MSIVNTLAYAFADQITDNLTREEMVDVIQVNRYNRKLKPDLCHSGDIIDSNMCMLNAFESVFGKLDLQCSIENSLRNAAWDMAKKNDFFRGDDIPPIETVLVIRHLDVGDARDIIAYIDHMAEQTSQQHTCVQQFSSYDAMVKEVKRL